MARRSVAWDPDHLPDLTGRTYLITGSNAGLGYFSAEQLARAGAHVVMSGRNPNRLAAARAAIGRRVPDASTESILLDTSNLGSVRAAAATVRARGAVHGLLLNAGIVHPPRRRETTPDGHEIVFATNVLGHFALAGALLTMLAATSRTSGSATRMVWLGSISTSMRRVDPADTLSADAYSRWRAYVRSKVATTALGLEADRRLRGAGVPVESVVAHPGYSTSGRTRGIRGVNEPTRGTRFADNLQTPVSQSKERGAWSLVRALVDPAVAGGEYWGPRFVSKGAPRRSVPAAVTRDESTARRLWATCERATAVAWPLAAAARS